MNNLPEAMQSYLSSLSSIQEWEELSTLLKRTATAKIRHWQLPVHACQAVGGRPLVAVPVASAFAALYCGIILVDDMIDADPKGHHLQWGCPATSHLAGTLQALGLEAIAQSDMADTVKATVINKLNSMLLSVALGQYWDVHNPQDENSYWRVVEMKSASFFGTAFAVGAISGDADEDTAERLESIGRIYGEMIQLHDDLHDVMQRPANPDWTEGRSPLPILFATQVTHPQQGRFQELRQCITKPAALIEAQTILVQCGAVSYVIDQLLQRHQRAEVILQGMTLSEGAIIGDLLNDAIQPVHHLLEMAVA